MLSVCSSLKVRSFQSLNTLWTSKNDARHSIVLHDVVKSSWQLHVKSPHKQKRTKTSNVVCLSTDTPVLCWYNCHALLLHPQQEESLHAAQVVTVCSCDSIIPYSFGLCVYSTLVQSLSSRVPNHVIIAPKQNCSKTDQYNDMCLSLT